MLSFSKYISFFLIGFLILSCKQSTLRKPVYNTTVFRGERGKKEVNAYNKNRAQREKDMAEAIEKADAAQKAIEDQKKELASIDSTQRISSLESKLQDVFKRTQEIVNELNSISPYTSKGHERALELSTELNNLMYNQINPLAELIESNKQVVRLGSDISFETGSSNLTKEGKKQVTALIQQIEKEIVEWKGYINHHNENIFNESEFRTIFVINGYADTQGSKNESERKELNVKLSKERADAVAKEFNLQMKSLMEKYKLTIELEVNGRGEDAPPNYKPGKKLDDESRRICNINFVVGPKMLMYNEK